MESPIVTADVTPVPLKKTNVRTLKKKNHSALVSAANLPIDDNTEVTSTLLQENTVKKLPKKRKPIPPTALVTDSNLPSAATYLTPAFAEHGPHVIRKPANILTWLGAFEDFTDSFLNSVFLIGPLVIANRLDASRQHPPLNAWEILTLSLLLAANSAISYAASRCHFEYNKNNQADNSIDEDSCCGNKDLSKPWALATVYTELTGDFLAHMAENAGLGNILITAFAANHASSDVELGVNLSFIFIGALLAIPDVYVCLHNMLSTKAPIFADSSALLLPAPLVNTLYLDIKTAIETNAENITYQSRDPRTQKTLSLAALYSMLEEKRIPYHYLDTFITALTPTTATEAITPALSRTQTLQRQREQQQQVATITKVINMMIDQQKPYCTYPNAITAFSMLGFSLRKSLGFLVFWASLLDLMTNRPGTNALGISPLSTLTIGLLMMPFIIGALYCDTVININGQRGQWLNNAKKDGVLNLITSRDYLQHGALFAYNIVNGCSFAAGVGVAVSAVGGRLNSQPAAIGLSITLAAFGNVLVAANTVSAKRQLLIRNNNFLRLNDATTPLLTV